MNRLPTFACMFFLPACAGGPPTFKADITNADGKLTHHVSGSVDDNKPWLERYAGPVGILLSGIGYIFMPATAP